MTSFLRGLPGDQVAIWCANTLLQFSLVMAVALVVSGRLRRHSATRHAVLKCGLMLSLAIPILAAVMQSSGAGPIPVAWTPVSGISAATQVRAVVADGDNRNSNQVAEPPGTAIGDTGGPPVAVSAAAPDLVPRPAASAAVRQAIPASAWTATRSTAVLLLLLVWLVGTSLLLLRLAVAMGRMGFILHRARPTTDAVLNAEFLAIPKPKGIGLAISEDVSSPVAAGLWRRRILVPACLGGQLTRDQARQLLAHEVCHLRRHDQGLVLLQHLAVAFYWIHPLIWVFQRQLAQAREEVCDNDVLKNSDPVSYSRTLLTLTEWIQDSRPLAGCVGLLTSRWTLEQRIARLLDDRNSRETSVSIRTRALLTGAAGILIVCAGAITLRLASAEETAVTNQDPSGRTPSGAMVIKGRISNEDGSPVPGASVSYIGTQLRNEGGTRRAIAEGKTDAAGRFELKPDGINLTVSDTVLVARAAGRALAWKSLDGEGKAQEVNLTLPAEEPVVVRLVDADDRPAAGLVVKVVGLTANGNAPRSKAVGSLWISALSKSTLADFLSLSTDAQGQLSIPAVPAGHGIFLEVQGTEHLAPQFISLNTGQSETRPESDGTYRGIVKNFAKGQIGAIVLARATPFAGIVWLGDTGKPAAQALVTVWSSEANSQSMVATEGLSDSEGRFRVNPQAGAKFHIQVKPPAGSMFLARSLSEMTWSKQASQEIEIRLPAAQRAEGTIVDAVSGKPLVRASVQYLPANGNRSVPEGFVSGGQAMQLTDHAGRFAIAVPPGPGTLLFHAPSGSNYILQERGQRELLSGKPGGIRYYAHSFYKINPSADGADAANPDDGLSGLNIKLQPGGTIVAKLVDEAGNPIPTALYTSRLMIFAASPFWRCATQTAVDGRAVMTGVEPDKQYPVYFLEPRLKLGAVATVSLDDPEPTVTLKPCASAQVRFLSPDGRAVKENSMYGFEMVVTPGICKHQLSSDELAADECFIANFDRLNYARMTGTDKSGDLLMPALIPGATYRFHQFVGYGSANTEKEFVAESGKHHNLGEIVLKGQ